MFFGTLIILIGLTACTRVSTTPRPGAEDTATGEVIFPVATKLGATLPPVSPFGTATNEVVAHTEPTATPIVVMDTPSAPTSADTSVPQVIVPTATEGLPGGCTPNVAPYLGLGPGQPTFGICGVVRDVSVTIQTNDFIAGQTYTVFMGTRQTNGLGGVVIGTYSTNGGGRYSETYPIPDSLKGMDEIAVRLEFSSGWAAWNYFFNLTTN